MKCKMLQPGVYKADKDGWDGYELTVDIKETEKSLILKIIDYKFRYSPAQIDMLFKTDFDHMSYEEQQNIKNGKYRAVIKKQGGGHALRLWGDNSFTLYPYQSGIPFYFVKQ
ncbi:MAG TPA: hypothetical protein OIL97_04730 [Oscillospiraceae bacterium]|nr:hypothetical protein [Oscillospiraceae bacterium]